MKKSKKLISSILLIFAIANMGVLANETTEVISTSDEPAVISPAPTNDIDNGNIAIECGEASHLTAYGEIVEVGEGYIVVNTNDDQKIQFNYDENTYMINSDGVSTFDIANRTSDKVIISHDIAMTRSIPAQTYAYAIIGNVDGELGYPVYTEVESVEKTDDGIVISTDNGSLLVTVPSNASVSPFLTKNIVRLEDVIAGSKVLLWYDAVMQSLPAQAYSEKVVILAGNGEISEGDVLLPENTVSVNGIVITLGNDEAAYDIDGTRMLPIRTVAESLGYTVTWDGEEVSVSLHKDDEIHKVYVNEVRDEYYTSVASRTVNTYPKAVLNGNKTYVEESFFASL